MTEHGKDKLLLFVGSLGWIAAGIFIVLFFVMLRPSDYREGYNLGREGQKAVNMEKLNDFFAKAPEGEIWVAGDVKGLEENALIVHTQTLRTNPLGGQQMRMQKILIDEDTEIEIFTRPPVDPNTEPSFLTQDDSFVGNSGTIEDILEGHNVRYLPRESGNILLNEIVVSRIQVTAVAGDGTQNLDPAAGQIVEGGFINEPPPEDLSEILQ